MIECLPGGRSQASPNKNTLRVVLFCRSGEGTSNNRLWSPLAYGLTGQKFQCVYMGTCMNACVRMCVYVYMRADVCVHVYLACDMVQLLPPPN